MNNDSATQTASSFQDTQLEETIISVIVPVVERYDDLEAVYNDFAREVSKVTDEFEFIFVVEASQRAVLDTLRKIRRTDDHLRIFRCNGNFGESTALDAAFARARGHFVFTLSAYFQVHPDAFHSVYEALLEGNADLVITRRHPRRDRNFNRLQSQVFHWIASQLAGMRLQDVSCGFRAMRRDVAQSLALYADLHRFIPALANKNGFRVREIDAEQHPQDTKTRVYSLRIYLRRLLDTFTLFFLMKFTKKPLRFFATVGAVLSTTGFVICAYMTALKLLYNQGLADRPLLLLGVMLLVAGVQTIAIGLIGELIVYTLARESKDYQIEKILD